MKQDGKEFSPANDAMLQQAADGELVLWAFTRRHTAKLCAFPWAVAPTQATRSCAAGLVPTMPELANDVLGFPGTTLKNYLATDPTDCLESHPWNDHYWVLDEPQAVTREQVYFQQTASNAALVVDEGASGGVEHANVDWRNIVRAEAWEKWVKTLAENGTPTLENVSKHLADWCKVNEIKTSTGISPQASYLQIHVINSKHWVPPRNMSREVAKKHLEQKKHVKQAN